MGLLSDVRNELKASGDVQIAEHSLRFFKTGPGEYGEGDVFRGIRVPVLRKLAKRYQALSLRDTRTLLRARFHEDRLLALLILVQKYRTSDMAQQAAIFDLYLDNTDRVNNWDLVDASADRIVGAHLAGRGKTQLLDRLAASASLWERRIAIMATFHFTKHLHDFEPTLRIARMLLRDTEDLIHKATGWMLREIGNRDRTAEEAFLRRHYHDMPRTMLRYAIEKFPPARRLAYLHSKV
ncbi:MAG: DNA alkylation repair protein [Gammaproteobacteria bacterium]|nr:DNA alkylation repair protein [Gammaproteobacteria bacterium]